MEKLQGNGRTPRNAVDPKVTPLRKSRELHLMMKLRTVYPYGLNDRVGDEYMKYNPSSCIFLKFPPLKRIHIL